jgi:hypothetical protein
VVRDGIVGAVAVVVEVVVGVVAGATVVVGVIDVGEDR